ncbi:hypothetical protein E3U55_14515 [Filobacillus milosensis]|uniref:Uncharacterized protein n=1 Tax=Filobacillus milosensis TaxID=94137 RepID=A0A4Y8IG99_9BACI|nr:hypothetical protein [Filobacillus milosensis]TFB14124.1 hypothetical protein E3U55_14515 [Filobacillus milosensis]
MKRSLFKHEFKLTFFSKKNILFTSFLLVLLFSYVFMILPNEFNIESFQKEEVEHKLQDISSTQEWRLEMGYTGIYPMTGAYFASQQSYLEQHEKMVTAFENENYNRYLHIRTNYLLNGGYRDYRESDLFYQEPLPGKDKYHLYHKNILRFHSYLNDDEPITYPMIQERTALQKLHQFLTSSMIYLIIFAAIYFSSDVLIRDRTHQTLLQGFPTQWYSLLNVKSLAAFAYTLLIVTGVVGLGLILLSLTYGPGYLDMQIPYKKDYRLFYFEAYDYMGMKEFLLKSLALIPIVVYLFIRFNVLVSLLIRNTWAVLFIGTALLFSERLYFDRSTRELFGIDLSYFPQTYFDIGQVVTLEKNYLINTDTITFSQGLIVLLITLVVVELLLWITTRFINQRSFFQS